MARGFLLSALAIVTAACAGAPARETDYIILQTVTAPNRQPDGNTIMLETADGIVVIDTGRHRARVNDIVEEAAIRELPVIAIFNTHWHLDHISGNIALREAFPVAAVYSHRPALQEALSGFLARGAEANRKRIADPAADPGAREDASTDLATVEAGSRLYPTVSIERTQTLAIGGRTLDVHVAQAASAGDLWFYDPAARLAIAGDLVTLPAPFLDTACPKNWRAELDALLATPFEQLAPGHGRMMTRADVTLYRDAFGALLDCASSLASAEACADQWSKAAAPLLDESSGDAGQASAYAGYYVENILRKTEARPAWCPA
jgi:glyoxylase-like metal-dependent hydrolase (beta-lactamase superfamily II)